uniref:PH domain-containing protein n=1 Tax=Macrostomum lignano TaxID=282301 RepID=A0A1I8JRA0_9PLAT
NSSSSSKPPAAVAGVSFISSFGLVNDRRLQLCRELSAGAGERRSVPLRLSYLCRGASACRTPAAAVWELHSPCCKRSCLAALPDARTGQRLDRPADCRLPGRAESGAAGQQEVKQMGWLAEQVHDDSGHPGWRPAFCAISDRDILLYEAAPASREAWSSPMHQHPLLATRLVPTARQATYWLFGTRTGGRLGVEAHVFRVETEADLAAWSRTLVDAARTRRWRAPRRWPWPAATPGTTAALVLHADCGFSMREAASGRQLWCLPYESLRRSADDGQRLAWLDFGEQQASSSWTCSAVRSRFVFILHTILSSKLHR